LAHIASGEEVELEVIEAKGGVGNFRPEGDAWQEKGDEENSWNSALLFFFFGSVGICVFYNLFVKRYCLSNPKAKLISKLTAPHKRVPPSMTVFQGGKGKATDRGTINFVYFYLC
jgi:hypothetical protein